MVNSWEKHKLLERKGKEMSPTYMDSVVNHTYKVCEVTLNKTRFEQNTRGSFPREGRTRTRETILPSVFKKRNTKNPIGKVYASGNVGASRQLRNTEHLE